MLGVLYLLLCTYFGSCLCKIFLPKLEHMVRKTYSGKDTMLQPFLLLYPAWFLTGTLVVTWCVYIVALIAAKASSPLTIANAVVIPAVALFCVACKAYSYHKNIKSGTNIAAEDCKDIHDAKELMLRQKIENGCFVAAAYMFVSFLMFYTFNIQGNNMYVGFSVFSDFAPHLGMIRSFSNGANFPTSYSHFAGEDIRYHFMFQFLVGNLEFLGMRIDFAFNIPSILGMVAVYQLLLVLVVKITGSRLTGVLTALFFTFRSSYTVFTYMAEQPKGKLLSNLRSNIEFLGYTQNENWGLWNLNVYCNQRHLAFSLAIMLFAIILFMPYVYAMAEKLKCVKNKGFIKAVKIVKTMFFTKTAFWIQNPKMAVFMGVILGGIAFWNGSVLIATMAVLFFMAAVSDYRFDYLITAVTALLLALLQSRGFVDGDVISPAFYFGFLADNKTIPGVASYCLKLMGILLPMVVLAACMMKGVKRYLIVPFIAPLVIAFTLALTPDVTVNHKFIMMSAMLLSIYPAIIITKLIKPEKKWATKNLYIGKRILALILVVILTGTGFYDFTVLVKRNVKERNLCFDVNDPVTEWVMENSDADDIFLTPWYALNNVVVGGAMLYYGWPYFAWSAGYDTMTRDYNVRMMYQADSVEEFKSYIEEFGIRYVIVDFDCRTSTEYYVREDIIEAAYEQVASFGEGIYEMRIFDTTRPR